MNITIGGVVKDTISELTGTVTAKVEYMTGCIQYLVTPKWKQGETFSEGHWIDEIRLKIIPKKKAEITKKKLSYVPGKRGAGPPAPKRAGGQVGTTE